MFEYCLDLACGRRIDRGVIPTRKLKTFHRISSEISAFDRPSKNCSGIGEVSVNYIPLYCL